MKAKGMIREWKVREEGEKGKEGKWEVEVKDG